MTRDPLTPEPPSLPNWVRRYVEGGGRLIIQAGTTVEGEFYYMAVLQEYATRGYGKDLHSALEDLDRQLAAKEERPRMPRLAAKPLPSRPLESKPANPIESLLREVSDETWEDDGGDS